MCQEVVGSEGVLVIRGRKLVLKKGGVEQDVLLRDIQTVTSSAQGTIKVCVCVCVCVYVCLFVCVHAHTHIHTQHQGVRELN